MNRIQHTLFTLLVVGLLASVTGCGILNDAPDASGSLDTTNTARLRIGPDGGQVVSADGRVRVIIPPGAMVTEEIININVTYSVPTGTLGEAYQISPTSLVFDQDVKVVFSYLGLGAEVPEALAVSGIFAGGWRALMPGGLDPQAYEVTGLSRNLGFFALVDLTGIQPLSPFAEACSGDGADCAPVCIDDILVSRLCERGESASQCGVSRQTDCVALGKACVAGACRVLECTDDVDCESGCASADTKVASRCVAGACEYEASTCPNGDCVGSACREQSCSADTDCAASCDGETVIYSTCGDSGFCSSTSTMPCAQLGRSCVGGECVDKDCHTDNDCGSWCVGGTVHRGVLSGWRLQHGGHKLPRPRRRVFGWALCAGRVLIRRRLPDVLCGRSSDGGFVHRRGLPTAHRHRLRPARPGLKRRAVRLARDPRVPRRLRWLLRRRALSGRRPSGSLWSGGRQLRGLPRDLRL